jgi:formylglycine-generating enzyme required for sulfatase activity
MGKYEVTQREYLQVMGTNPSWFNGVPDPEGFDYGIDLNHPVERVNWHDATNYCFRLSEYERLAGRLPAGYTYRLPTEAEWEYTCRAGTTTPFHYGNELRSGVANFNGQYEYPPCGDDPLSCYNPSGICLKRTTAVGSYGPNGWGLYDMHGNAYEWCMDWYGVYPGGSVTDPQGVATAPYRANRGGTLDLSANFCRSATRVWCDPTARYTDLGFRVVLARVP